MSESDKFEKWADSRNLTGTSGAPRAYAHMGWQAALSTRKPYGYGIVDKDGKSTGDVKQIKENSLDDVAFMNRKHSKAPFRTVELFYEEQS